MINTFYGTNIYDVYMEALRLSSFPQIRASVYDYINTLDISKEQKLAIRGVAEAFGDNPHADEPLIKILNSDWESLGIVSDIAPTALAPADREGIIEIIMTVCKNIIMAEVNRLTNISNLDVTLPVDWNSSEEE